VALAREGVDRSALRRTDGAWLDAAWADPRTRVLTVADGRVPVDSEGSDAPRLLLCSPADAPPGERRLLGADADGVAYFSVDVPAPQALTGTTAGVREVGALLDNRDAGLLVQAVALANWHAVHTHCARCGTPTEVTAAGHVRQCPADGSQHFPRTDPAVIMPVVDAADRLLLARGATWPLGRMSTVAGFVEPGESLEQAVRREVREEVGIEIGAVDYLGSQPWPFPSSLMVGFIAHAETTRHHR
jgi:NAD+ diphosphatase